MQQERAIWQVSTDFYSTLITSKLLIESLHDLTPKSMKFWTEGTIRHRRADNIQMKLQEVGNEVVNCFHTANGRVKRLAIVDTVMKLSVP
jgi:hypothetical protein